MKRQEIIESLKLDIARWDDAAEGDITKLQSNRAIAARDIFLPMIEKMDDDWLQANRDISIMTISTLANGEPSMRIVKRLYPELLKEPPAPVSTEWAIKAASSLVRRKQ